MATPDKKRTSSRKFNIEKRGSYSFDLEKEELPVPDPAPAPVPEPPNGGDGGVQEDGNHNLVKSSSGTGKVWIGILLAIVVAVLAIWLIPKGCNNGTQSGEFPVTIPDSVEVAEVVEADEVSQDSVWNENGEYVAKGENPEAVDNGTTVSDEVPVASSVPSSGTNEEGAQLTPAVAPAKTVSTSTVVNVGENIEQEALKVIRGVYGDGLERKQKLGSKYQEIQNRVNQLKREGAF